MQVLGRVLSSNSSGKLTNHWSRIYKGQSSDWLTFPWRLNLIETWRINFMLQRCGILQLLKHNLYTSNLNFKRQLIIYSFFWFTANTWLGSQTSIRGKVIRYIQSWLFPALLPGLKYIHSCIINGPKYCDDVCQCEPSTLVTALNNAWAQIRVSTTLRFVELDERSQWFCILLLIHQGMTR